MLVGSWLCTTDTFFLSRVLSCSYLFVSLALYPILVGLL